MKLYSANGKGKGKLGGFVYSINHGVQVKREYNGSPSNPSTDSQVSQRSRFKLASQISAALAPVIGFPRKGIQSPRNLFVKRNMPYFYGDPSGAQVSYENLQLVQGNMSLPAVVVFRPTEGNMRLYLKSDATLICNRVIYSVFIKGSDNQLQLAFSAVVSDAGPRGDFNIETDPIAGDLVVYAYGMRDNSAKAKAKYGNYTVENAMDVAYLISSRALEMSDYTFTQTRGTTLSYDEEQSQSADANSAMLFITVINGGTVHVTIGQRTQDVTDNLREVVPLGGAVTLTCDNINNREFLGWYNNGEAEPFSTDANISITMNGLRDIIARWSNHEGLE